MILEVFFSLKDSMILNNNVPDSLLKTEEETIVESRSLRNLFHFYMLEIQALMQQAMELTCQNFRDYVMLPQTEQTSEKQWDSVKVTTFHRVEGTGCRPRSNITVTNTVQVDARSKHKLINQCYSTVTLYFYIQCFLKTALSGQNWQHP